ncbi:unnamed protein product [Choristocarpus tenellus]
MQLERVESLDKVFVCGAHGTRVYILLRGLVRVLHPVKDKKTGIIHEQYLTDLFPGDLIGDSVLEGNRTRKNTVVAVTVCDFATLEHRDFVSIRDHGPCHVSAEEKLQHLK